MKTKSTFPLILVCVIAGITAFLTTGCENTAPVQKDAIKALDHNNYRGALKTLLQLSDGTLEKNDTLMMMLSMAYNGVTRKSIPLDAYSIGDMDFTADGKTVFLTDLKEGDILEYSFPDMKLKRKIETGTPAYAIDLSPDGSRFALAGASSEVEIYETSSGKKLATLKGHHNSVRDVAFLDSIHLASGGNDQEVIFWDLSQNKAIDSQHRHTKNIKSLQRGNDSRSLVSASNDGTAIVWDLSDLQNARERVRVIPSRNYVNDAMLSPDGKTLVTVSGDFEVKTWNAADGSLNYATSIPSAGVSVDYSPGGKKIIVGGSSCVMLLDAADGKIIGLYPLSSDDIWSIKALGNNKFAFADSAHMYITEFLTGKKLIEASREWLKNEEK